MPNRNRAGQEDLLVSSFHSLDTEPVRLHGSWVRIPRKVRIFDGPWMYRAEMTTSYRRGARVDRRQAIPQTVGGTVRQICL